MKSTRRLTKTTVEKAMYQGTLAEGGAASKYVLWDSEIRGFGVRIFPTGRKSFVFAFWTDGRYRTMTIGDSGVLSVDDARKRAKALSAKVDAGADPLAERERKAALPTVEALCDAYLDRHAKVRKKTWEKDESRINRHVLPRWGKRKADSIARSDVEALHRKIGAEHGQYEANRTLEVIGKMFELAAVWGFVPDNAPNPARRIGKFKETKRDRFVQADELPALAEAINAEENVFVRSALWLYLLTGVRKNELLRARWEDVNFDRRELKIAMTKAGRPHYVPLTEQSIALLQGLPRFDGNPYIFPGMKRTGKHEVNADEPTPLVNIDKPWFRVRERAKLPDVRLHDLRRTVGSHLAMSGVPLLVIGKALNQTTAQTTMVYARLSQDPVREALERHARNLLASAGDPDIGEAASPDASKTASVHAIGKAHGGKRKQA